MKKIIFSAIFALFVTQIFAQTSVKLNGTTISSDNGYTYGQGTDFNGNAPANCFDGDLTTYFASSIDESGANDGTKGSRGSKGGWVGLDLGEKYVITSVKYAPRPDNTGRTECGIIEGANNPNFMDATAIGIIPDGAPANVLSVLPINSTRGFRYVRFYGSLQFRCNIAELEFWGYRNNGNDNHIGQLTNLPTINIHTTNEQVIDSKDNYVAGTISIIDGNQSVTDNLDIRGRGNASWNFKKRPYRIKFNSSTKIFGTPAKAKNWTLISNEGDKTLMRNLIAFDISKRLEMPYTPFGRLVDVVINGDYKGCYQLCDHIDVRAGRVNIDEMTAADNSGAALTGGYLLEIDAYFEGGNTGFVADRGVPVTLKSPDKDIITTEQTDYIRNHFNAWQNAVMNNGNFEQYTDIETFVRHFLIGEFSGNTDTYWSVYMYKKRNDDKFYFAPIWDYDLAFENDSRTYSIMERTWQNNNQWLYIWGGNDAHNTDPLITKLLSYPNVYQRLKEVWAHYRDYGRITEEKLLQTIDNYATEINTSQDLNFKRWDNLQQYEHMMWERGDYANNINIVKNYLRARLAWLDTKLEYVPNPVEDAVTNPEFKDIKIFSNNNNLIISNLTELTKISCFDVSGKIIFENFAENNFSKHLPQGIYLVKLTKQNGASQTFKLIMT